jgi:hypothetical protein
VRDNRTVGKATDLEDLFPQNDVHFVNLPAAEEDLQRLRTGVFATARSGDRLLITSATSGDFSWELVNRLIVSEPALGIDSDLVEIVEEGARLRNPDCTMLLFPSLLDDTSRLRDGRQYTENAVILARRDVSLISDIADLAQGLRTYRFIVRGVVAADCNARRWRKWRRFTRAYGVCSDPEHPWPAIDVLDEENARTGRARGRRDNT